MLPTEKQKDAAIFVCQLLSNLYESIHLFRCKKFPILCVKKIILKSVRVENYRFFPTHEV
ncbi:DUF6888 family protein [Crocosphaera sp. Alani8]|uniref:DUF6888 family protein n=1 Tax=Crocosphaera sp. Alani8 TaxID=3038952 RepID=UPI00406C96CC